MTVSLLFDKVIIQKLNLTRNSKLKPIPQGFISGQGKGEISQYKYGLCRMSFNGCEVISVYNLLLYIGRPVNICELISYMERFKMLFGIFGCNPLKIGKALDFFKIEYEKSLSENTSAFILSFWTGTPFMSSIHTVFCERENGIIKVYNRYSNCTRVRFYRNISELTGNRCIIAMYCLNAGRNQV